jgi:myo-inositol-1(or 4)-monophosphatase
LNGRPIAVSQVDSLTDAFVATGFPYDIRVNPENNLDHFARFATRTLALRRPGAASIDLAYVACGRFDGFWELRLAPWDVAAGALLIQEAGGRITNHDGTPLRLGSAGVCASNGRIHDAMLAVLAGKEPGG